MATLVEVGGHHRCSKHAGLKKPRPINPLYKALLSYRNIKLENSSLDRTTWDTGKVCDCSKWMALSLMNQ